MHFEEIKVQTSDGYILVLHRVHSKDGPTKGPMLLQHGLLDSSDTWILNFRDHALGFMLADAGHDVYFGNSRGNKYRSGHVSLPESDAKFWDFSWDEMALYDLPAIVDAVLATSRQAQVAYVGHSQGCAIMFAALVSEIGPALTHKISHFYALAPVTFAQHTTSPLLKAMAGSHFDDFVNMMGVKEFMPSTDIMRQTMPWFCTSFLFEWMCDSALYYVAGFNPAEMDESRKEVFFSHYPAGTSVKDMVHWAQNIRSVHGDDNGFCRFDYGAEENIKRYGSEIPPSYDLADFPTNLGLTIYSGTDDKIANPMDVQRMVDGLSGVSTVRHKELPSYDHLDFVWGSEAAADIYTPIIQDMQQRDLLKSAQGSARIARVSVPPAVIYGCVGAGCVAVLGAAVFILARRPKTRRAEKALDQCNTLDQSLLV